MGDNRVFDGAVAICRLNSDVRECVSIGFDRFGLRLGSGFVCVVVQYDDDVRVLAVVCFGFGVLHGAQMLQGEVGSPNVDLNNIQILLAGDCALSKGIC